MYLMKVILVDDDKAMILILKRIMNKIEGVEIINTFNSSINVLEFIKDNCIDMVFLDISMPGENGMELARSIYLISPSTDIVFITSHREYAVDAFEIYAFDYIIKPVLKERVERTIKRAFEKKSLLIKKIPEKEKNISVYLLGGIDVSSKSLGTVKWMSAKSMELFIYLLLNGGRNISKNVIIEDVFQGMPLKNAENYLKTSVYQIRKAFEPHASDSILILKNGYYKLECSEFYVDFMDFEKRIERINEINEENIKDALDIEKIFVGELLGDRVYYWSISENEKYLNCYLNLAIKLVKYLLNNGELNSVSYILKKIIKFDALNQEANCLLMKLFEAQKDKKSLIKHFQGYERMIKKEFGVNPGYEIINCYEKLLKSFS